MPVYIYESAKWLFLAHRHQAYRPRVMLECCVSHPDRRRPPDSWMDYHEVGRHDEAAAMESSGPVPPGTRMAI